MAGVKAFDENAPKEGLSPEEYAKRAQGYIPQARSIVHTAHSGLQDST